MPRPTNKEQPITAAVSNFEKLFLLIDSIPKERPNEPFSFEDRGRNIRDIHLFEWHQLFINWATLNYSGKKADLLPKPYNWKSYPSLNSVCKKSTSFSVFDFKDNADASVCTRHRAFEGFENKELTFVSDCFKIEFNF